MQFNRAWMRGEVAWGEFVGVSIFYIVFLFLLRSTIGFIVWMLPFMMVVKGLNVSKKETGWLVSLLFIVATTPVLSRWIFISTIPAVVGLRIFYFVALVVLMASPAQGRGHIYKPFCGFVIYLCFQSVSSLLGWSPLISECKLLLFFVFLFACLQVVSHVTMSNGADASIRARLIFFATFFVVGSVLVYPFPQISYSCMYLHKSGLFTLDRIENLASLYSGVLNHPQALGPVVVAFNSLIACDLIFNIRKRSWLHVFVLVCAPVCVYLTGSRTAMGAYLFASFLIGVVAMRSGMVSCHSRVKIFLIALCLVGLGVSAVVCSSEVRQSFMDKIAKTQTKSENVSDVSFDRFVRSRRGLVEDQIANFKDAPIIGNGFQVSKELAFGMKRGDTTLIFSAPIEKGVWVSMVLEEGGILGFLIFVVAIVQLLTASIKKNWVCFGLTFVTMLVLNLGEATIFSPSGMGGALWVICFCGLMLDQVRNMKLWSVRK